MIRSWHSSSKTPHSTIHVGAERHRVGKEQLTWRNRNGSIEPNSRLCSNLKPQFPSTNMVSLLQVHKKGCRVPETPTSTSVELAVLLPRNQTLTQSSWPEHHRKSKSRGRSPCAAQSSVLIRCLRICRLSTLSRHFGLQRLGSKLAFGICYTRIIRRIARIGNVCDRGFRNGDACSAPPVSAVRALED
jgi:hypothetical protein